MAIKFEKIEPGMILLDIHREKMGNTTMSQWGCWPVKIISIDRVKRTARVVWNSCNPEETWHARDLEKLYREGKEPKGYREQQERRRNGSWL